MSLQENANAATAPPVPVIENEIPTYRAISAGAVVSLILGGLSVLCYTSLGFQFFAIGAVVIGGLSLKKIHRMPDVLTGAKFAQAGVLLGLAFGLSSFTIVTVQGILRGSAARTFARQFQHVLAERPIDDCIWWNQHPERRRGLTPVKLMAEIKGQPQSAPMMDMQAAPFRDVKSRLETAGATIRFVKIEDHADTGTGVEAAALYELHAPNWPRPAERETYVLAVLKGAKFKGKMEWWVDSIVCPYKPSTYVAPQKPVDEHGHGH